MTKILIALLIVCLLSASPLFGWNASHIQTESITITKKKRVRVLYGVVLDASDAPIEGVNVEVLNNGEWIVKGKLGSDVEQHIIASGKTNVSGKFRFKNLPAGKYEVRFTATGFNELHVYVEVNSNIGSIEGVKINLSVAT